MGLETATYVDSLVVSNPDGTDQRSTADDHLRLIKACLKRTFPQVGGAVSASAQAISYVNDLSASAQGQLNVLREGSATANNAVNSRYANSASKATVIASLSNTFSVNAANVPDLIAYNVFTAGVSGLNSGLGMASTNPGLHFNRTGAAVDEKHWQFFAGGGSFAFRAMNDAGTSATNFMVVNRTGLDITILDFTVTSQVRVNGYNVLSPPAMNGIAASSWARRDSEQTFVGGQGSEIVSLTDGATITPDCAAGNVFRVTLAGSRTMAAPINARPGQTIVFHILQDATGSRTLLWNAIYKFAGSVDSTLTTAASAVDVFAFNYDPTGSGAWRQAGLNVG